MKDDYFSENMVWYTPKVKKNGGWVPISTLIISIVATIFLVLLVVAKWQDILWFFGVSEWENSVETDAQFSVGDQISMTWVIESDWDLSNYTHTITNLEYGTLWLKSSKFNLSNYSNEVYLEWMVEKIYKWMVIVSVSTIYNVNFDDEWILDDENTGKQEKFLSNAWVYFSEKFFEKYSLVNGGEWWVLKVKDTASNVIIPISYFRCNSNSINEDCAKLTKNIWWAASQKVVDNYGITYYKQANVESWYFTNNLHWYFINDIQDSYVRDLSKYMTIINDRYAEKNILPNVKLLCADWNVSMKNVTNKSLILKWSKIVYSLEWNDWNWTKIICELEVDPTLTNFANILNFSYDEWEKVDNTEWDNNSEINEVSQNKTDWNPNVAQFPINLEKKLTFTSSRWHSYIFPSSNLSYQWFSVSENFDQAGVNCIMAMNVVSYPNKELVETEPSVKIYECNVKKWFDDSDQTLIYRQVWDKHFVIQILDPAWVDFANNIEIQINE